MSRPDRHNEIEVNLLTTGSLTYLLEGRRIVIEASRFAVFSAAMPHQIVGFRGCSPREFRRSHRCATPIPEWTKKR